MEEKNQISWPGWDIGACIGKGGFGAVYEIRREVFGDVERCALKVITIPKDASEIEYMRCEGMDDESITTTLHAQVGDIIREYKLMSRMRENPNIVHCDDFRYTRHEDDLGWDIYIKMELLTPLMKALNRVQTEEQIIRLGKDMCNALMACQEVNIIHRDIKPQNIFISPKGHFKLGDFGIARTMEHTTKATAGIGTYSFMAPEVALGKSYGPTVDIYSLGLVLYWLLNERRSPFVPLPPAVSTVAVNEEARVRRYSGEQIPPPKHGSEELKAVVLKASTFAPQKRYQTVQELLAALNRLPCGKLSESEEEATVRIGVHKERRKSQAQTFTPSSDGYRESVNKTPFMTEPRESKVTVHTSPSKPHAVTACGKADNSGSRPQKQTIWLAVICTILVLEMGLGLSLWRNSLKPQMMEKSWTDNVLMADEVPEWIVYNGYDTFVMGSNISRGQITSITFLDTLKDVPADSWDVSEKQDNSVRAWVMGGNALYIGANGGINAKYCKTLFYGYYNVSEIYFNHCFHTDYATNMESMFDFCPALRVLDISDFNTANVTDMSGMFYDCSSLASIDLSSFDTSSVTDMSCMFTNCSALKSLDLSNFNTSIVTNMYWMFCKCLVLADLNISGFCTGNVVNMENMFSECPKLETINGIECFDTRNVASHDDFMEPGKIVNGRPWEELFAKK